MTSIDAVPSIDQFRPVVLRILSDGKERGFRQLCEEVADAVSLSEAARQAKVPTGKPSYVNRIGWACSSFTHAGLLHKPRRAVYVITPDGLALNARQLDSYSERDMLEWPRFKAYKAELAARDSSGTASEHSTVAVTDGTELDPVETIRASVRDYNAMIETELRKRLQDSSPEFFENAVIELLWAMGYGGSHGDKERVGRTGDGGIDGIIKRDALGLDNIYVQAKRYADSNNVGSNEIRNFMGALVQHGASQGVFITTASFTKSAIDAAKDFRSHGRIVLIDGIELTRLMLNYGVAVHAHQNFTFYSIDEDFFDEDSAQI